MKEKIFRIILIILIIILMYQILKISAAYKTALEDKITGNIEPWKILVNDVDITTNETKVFEINGFVDETNNIAEGKIAPGSTFKIPISIDAKAVKGLDVRYDITVDSIEEVYPKIDIKNILEEKYNTPIIKTSENTYTGIIFKEKEKTHELIVNLIWENNEENNEMDTAIGTNLKERTRFSVPITICVSQYLNEPIMEYKEE